jgi:hypothetical protein
MISTLTSFSVPSQIITGIAAGVLLIMLVVIHLYSDSPSARKFMSCLGLFAAPLLVFLGFSIISYVFNVLTS